MATPAEQAGFIVGSKAKYIGKSSGGSYSITFGEQVTLVEDDGTQIPLFECKHGRSWLALHNVELIPIKPEVEIKIEAKSTISIQKVGSIVTIAIEGIMTKEKVAAILNVMYD